MEGMGLLLWSWALLAIGFVAGAAWYGLGAIGKRDEAILYMRQEERDEARFCATCPVNHIKEEIES